MRSAGFAGWARSGRGLALAGLASVAAGCGSSDTRTPSGERPPTPIEVSAKVDSKQVVVSPSKFGAGLVDFSVANLSNRPITFRVNGPTKGSTPPVQPGAPGALKMTLEKGVYVASAGDGTSPRPDQIHVGPPRNTSQNKLLLP